MGGHFLFASVVAAVLGAGESRGPVELQPEHIPGGLSFLFQLLEVPLVRDDLRLSKDQIADLAELYERYQLQNNASFARHLRDEADGVISAEEQRRANVEDELTEETTHRALEAQFSTVQRLRLTQIVLQTCGTCLFTEAAWSRSLQLSVAQRRKIETIAKRHWKDVEQVHDSFLGTDVEIETVDAAYLLRYRTYLFRKVDLDEAVWNEMERELTDGQRATLAGMLGEPIERRQVAIKLESWVDDEDVLSLSAETAPAEAK